MSEYETLFGVMEDLHCNNCDDDVTVRLGADACPSCGFIGGLCEVPQ